MTPYAPLSLCAAILGVCTTVLKKVCRHHGIRRWPQRKLQSLNKRIDVLETTAPVARALAPSASSLCATLSRDAPPAAAAPPLCSPCPLTVAGTRPHPVYCHALLPAADTGRVEIDSELCTLKKRRTNLTSPIEHSLHNPAQVIAARSAALLPPCR